MAEKEGFEPSIPFWGIHDFQSCALDQLRDFSMKRTDFGRVEISLLIIHDIVKIVKWKSKNSFFREKGETGLRSPGKYDTLHPMKEGTLMLCDNIEIRAGCLYFAGRSLRELAEKYGTPLYLLDEDRIRENCRTYVRAMREAFPRAMPLYASKALSLKALYRIMAEEGMGIDVVSAGELYRAHAVGFPMERVHFHGSSKTDEEIALALSMGVGCFVVDGRDELEALDRLAAKAGVRQRILLRLTPGIDPHTFAAVATGKVDSKFGTPIVTGQAEELLTAALGKRNVEVRGYHCHVGSQVFESTVFLDAADIMLAFARDMEEKHGFFPETLDLGGGYGVRYVKTDPKVDLAAEIRSVGHHVAARCRELGIREPEILMEPGRSIVADAGMTLYTVEAVKSIPGYKSYVCVDGGMTDNPRYALYRSAYTVLSVDRPEAEPVGRFTIGGRCCESGDMLQENVVLPALSRGDLLAVCTTGAYNHSMSSNYNSVPRPPMVGLSGGKDRLLLRRETYEDLLEREY